MKKIPRRHRRTFYKFLQTELGEQIPSEFLPRRIRVLGHVAILWLDSKIIHHKELIGQTTLKYNKKIQSVLRRTEAIAGPYRQPAVELIAGSPETKTVFRENKVVFHIDPMKVMFSVGNKAERLRMSKLGSDEIVVDMFAGIGQLSLPMAVHARPKIIHAIEWNPDAFHFLEQNIRANKASDIVQPHMGDTQVIAPTVGREQADRVIMGLIQGTASYLDQGIQCVRSGGMMHIHEIGPKDNMETALLSKIEQAASSYGKQVAIILTRKIKTYNPQYNHFVLDLQVNDQ